MCEYIIIILLYYLRIWFCVQVRRNIFYNIMLLYYIIIIIVYRIYIISYCFRPLVVDRPLALAHVVAVYELQ